MSAPGSARRRSSAAPATELPARRWLALLSPGTGVILGLAAVSTLAFLFWPVPRTTGRDFWVFGRPLFKIYEPLVAEWNCARPQDPLRLSLIHPDAMERRMLSGFMAGTPVADLLEIERAYIGRVFTGPVEGIGLLDLTDRLRAEGLLDRINRPSFSPWTSRGRIYGIPHDVHPCVLGYRADIVEAAGIDMSRIETWDDFHRLLGPLVKDLDGDGRPDRYLLNFWPSFSNRSLVEAMILQAGGHVFDEQERPTLDTPLNARVLATLTTWVAGPRRMGIDAPEFSAAGDEMRNNGTVLCSVMPDWLAGIWRNYNPALRGKIKVIPLPAWSRGGRRTSTFGGTMLGIARTAPDHEKAWAMAKHLYLSPEAADRLFKDIMIITPVKAFWSRPVFHEPDPYFCNQKIGEIYIALAPDVPVRSSSPDNVPALDRLNAVLIGLRDHAIARATYDVEALIPEAHRRLAAEQPELESRIARNVFLRAASSRDAP